MLQIKIFIFNPIQENTYLLYDETKEAAIIDCGANTTKEKNLLADFIKEENLTLKHVLNTHLHFDHILGNQFLYETFGIKPEYCKTEENMPGLKEGKVSLLFPIKYTHIFSDKDLNDGDEIVFGNTKLKALLTPGHSPGSLSFYSEKDCCVFTGDALFHNDIGRTDLWQGDFNELTHSIRTKLFTLPDDTVVYPGHEESSTIGEEKIYNPYFSETKE
jgi:glyoxylase-like metal-dependent hydrolase (beta-lactamase superfamily II)